MEITNREILLEVANILVRRANEIENSDSYQNSEDYDHAISQFRNVAEVIRACFTSTPIIPTFLATIADEARIQLTKENDAEWLEYQRLKNKFNG